MADRLKDFFIGIGFRVDEPSQKKAEASVAQSEAKLTASTVKELDRRRSAEDKMLADRVNAIVSVGGELDAEEKAAAARFLRTQKETADKQAKADTESAKATKDRREKGWKDAQAFILRFAALASKAAVAVEAAALGVVYATDKAAKSFEALNYAAQRIGAAPRSINAFTYAASQLGSSVGEAQGSLEKFGENLRRLPGFTGYIESLGVRTRDAKGQMRDAADIATDLGGALAKIRDSDPRYGYTNAIARAGNLGFDENTARALMDPNFARREGQFRADQAKVGADPDATARYGTAFEQSMRHLEEVAGAVSTKIDEKLFQKIQPLLDRLAEWIASNGDHIATIVGRVADDLVKLASALGEAMGKIDWDGLLTKAEHAFTEFDALARKYFGKDGLTTVFEAFGAVLALNVLAKLTAMISALQTLSGIPLFTRLLTLLGVGGVAATAGLAAAALAATTTGLDGNSDRNPGGTPGTGGFYTDPSGSQHSLRRVWDGVKRAVGAGRAKLGRKAGMEAVPYEPGEFTKVTGATAAEYKATRDGIADIEGSRYNQMGGSSGRFAGRYQMGAAEIAETAASLGEPAPSTQQFLGDPQMQERYFERYTLQHYRQLMQNPRFRALPLRQRLEILGYAHNQGVGSSRRNNGAMGYLNSGSAGTDAFGTSGTAYFAPIRARLAKVGTEAPKAATNFGSLLGIGSAAAAERPKNPYGSLDPNAFKSAPLGPSVSSMYQSYDNSRSRGDTTVNANQTFNIQGGDVRGNLAAAKMAAGRGNPDWVRNLQSAEQ